MRRITFLLLLFTSSLLWGQADSPLIGKWDITFNVDEKEMPSWLEVKNSGVNTLVGHFVYAFGSSRPVAYIKMDGMNFYFSIPRQWEPVGQDMVFSGVVEGDEIQGVMIYVDGSKQEFKGVRAPKLKYEPNPTWGEPQNLFNGKDLSGWKADRENQWKVVDGVLTSEKSGANLISEAKFDDFKLHIEFRYPEGSNSGLYLRGRYEVQIADNYGLEPSNILFGGIYGFIEPTEMVAKKAGEWQSYDITLIGNRVTIVGNGKPIIIDRPIPGITGGALDSNEGAPGPFMIQGDHGPVEYRNIIVTPRVKM